jgi:hypothetical protein
MACSVALQQCTSGETSWYRTFHLSTMVALNLVLTSLSRIWINVVPMVGEAAHDGVVGGQSVFFGPVDIRGTEDCIVAAVKGDGDVLVAAASSDGESTSVVGVELGKREFRDVELVAGGQCGGLVNGIFWYVSGWCIWRGKWCKAVWRSGLGLGGA